MKVLKRLNEIICAGLIIGALFFPSKVKAQFVGLNVFSENNVLPTNDINLVYQTEDGFMWIGTEGEGLIRFDGKNTVQFTTLDGLRSNSVTAFFEDHEHNIWIGDATGGVALFENGQISYPSSLLQGSGTSINDIYEDSNNTLWISTLGNGLFKVEGDNATQFDITDGLRSDTVWSVRQFGDDLWVLGNNGIAFYNLDREVITWQNQKDERAYFDAARKADDSIWLATSNGIVIMGDSVQVIDSIDGEAIGKVVSIDNRFGEMQTIVLSENLGILLYNGDFFIQAVRLRSDPAAWPKLFYKDLNRMRWIVTEQVGINFLTNHAIFRYGLENEGVFNINSLHEDSNGYIWIGAREGLALVKPLGVVGYLSAEMILDVPVYDIIEHQGALYLLSENNEIYRYSEELGLTLLESLVNLIPDDRSITDLYFDRKSRLWIGTDKGLGVHDSRELTWRSFSESPKGNYVLHITEQENGNILVGTGEAIHILNDGEDVTPEVLKDELAGVQVRYILPSGENYWIGTTRGLYAYIGSTSSLYHYNDNHGIISQNIQGLSFLGDSTLFVATSGGMHKLNIDESFGIESTYFRLNNDYSGANIHHSAVLVSNGVVWFGTDSGVYSYDERAEPDYNGPQLYFNSISIDYVRNGGTRFAEKLQEYPQPKNIVSNSALRHTENNLTFNFAGIDFASPERLTFSYRLVGSMDERWTPFDFESTVTIENLEPGSYEFQVRGKNDLELISSEPLSFSFLIDPPFYRTYWFFTLITLFVVGLLFTLERIRLKWLESNKLRELVEERTLSLRENLKEREILIQEVHHRTKNNLAVISGLLELQKSQIDDENVRHSLVQAQVRVQSIALIHEKLYKNDTLSKINFRNYVEDLVQVIARSYNFERKAIDVKLDIDEIDITLDQGIPCGLILNELVSNAYEHAFKGKNEGEISISFKNKGKSVVFEVKDTGIGFPKEYDRSKSTSLGMTLVHTLTQQINGKLQHINTDGTRFVITFKRDHY